METVKIRDDAHYDEVVKRMLVLEELPNPTENEELNMLAEAVQRFDDLNHPEPPKPLRIILEEEMFKRRLKQRGMAELLGVHETRLSELLKGKRPLSYEVAQKLWKVLGVPAETVLSLPAIPA